MYPIRSRLHCLALLALGLAFITGMTGCSNQPRSQTTGPPRSQDASAALVGAWVPTDLYSHVGTLALDSSGSLEQEPKPASGTSPQSGSWWPEGKGRVALQWSSGLGTGAPIAIYRYRVDGTSLHLTYESGKDWLRVYEYRRLK